MPHYMTTTKGNTYQVYDTPGEKGTIIAVHGLTGNHKQFYHFQEALTGDYRFISYDIRGRGDSDPGPEKTSIFTHADDLVNLIEKLDIKRPILMGYSMGAYICALVASRLPDVRALILLDGAGEASEMSRELVLPSLNRLKKTYPSKQVYIEEVKNMYTNLKIDWTDLLSQIVEYDINKHSEGWKHKSDADVMGEDFESFYKFDPMKTGKAISCPAFLLIAHGKIGAKAPLFQEEGYKKIQESIPQTEVHYTDVNHYELVFNKQKEILAEIKYFLKDTGVK